MKASVGAFVISFLTFLLLWTLHSAAVAANELYTVDGVYYARCHVEDCSDQPGQIGVWINDGHKWLSIGERSYEIA